MTTKLAPGDTLLGKYRVERVLGQGGMGAVVAARHIELGELYAIKVMLPHMLANEDSAERFLREARASAKLKGEHAARVHDVGRAEDGTLFMVMEHLEGSDLKTLLAQRGRLPVEEAITYVMQACEALAEAHEVGIVHRDVKPANLFLTLKRKKNAPHIKVLDFGISKEIGPEPREDLTKSGTMLGSPLYMSPEQMEHARKVDVRTDIWSLGVVLYEFVTGVVPFAGETFTQVVHSVMSLEPAPIRSHVADAPVALDVVLKRCFAKDPSHRYASVDALSEALEKVLKNEPVGDASIDDMHASTNRAGLSPRILSPLRGVDDLASTDVGTDEPCPDKPAPELQPTIPAVAKPSLSDAHKSDEAMTRTLSSVAPPAVDPTKLPRKRAHYVDYVAMAGVGVVCVSVVVAIGFRLSPDAGENALGTVVANDSGETARVKEPPHAASNVPVVASATPTTMASAVLSAGAVTMPSALVPTTRATAVKPVTSAAPATTTTTTPVMQTSPEPSWSAGPL